MIPTLMIKFLPSILSAVISYKMFEEEGKTERTIIASIFGASTFIIVSLIWKLF